ncbi:MAG: hypothetical protein ACJATA_000581 [Sphingobacteriales bacterium]|jgi:hypothetical protein
MKRFSPDFPQNLQTFDFSTLENSRDSIYAISPEFKLIYFNLGWVNFSLENAHKDPRFSDNLLVLGPPNVVFYAGIVLKGDHDLPIGNLVRGEF